ncbi:MAG TPA: PHB depolymerase family esterase [Candidatus Binatia bacterium]
MRPNALSRYAMVLALAVLAAGCGDASSSGGKDAALVGSCPAGFTPQPGFNDGFPSDGAQRQFHVLLPDAGALDTPRPLFVSLTGTVQEELSFAAQSGLDQLPADGWIVAAPVRTCSQNRTNCAQIGSDGRIWEPWYDGTIGGPSDDEGPDVRFVEAMVHCIAARWPVDARRIYVGGISAGGSFTNRIMTFSSDLFAGGVPASGNWYDGLAAPRSPITMDPSIEIVIWGGPNDVWPPVNPIANYDPETRLAAQYYAAQPNVVTVSCTGSHGHIWPTAMTSWLVRTLLSHPKGSDPADFVLTEPPPGFSCVVGPYTDH